MKTAKSNVEYRAISEIKKYPGNPRTIKKDEFKRLISSIKKNPDYFEARPIILSDRTGELIIIAGNQRYDAAIHLKRKEVPTFLMRGLTEEREKEIILRDNINNGDWDFSQLQTNWDSDFLKGLDLGLDFFKDQSNGSTTKKKEVNFTAKMNKCPSCGHTW